MTKILYVEDNEDNIFMLSRRLKKKGFDVIAATDGAKGVRAASAENPDLVLMDLGLPIIDGWEATRLIKSNPRTQDVPIIILTAHAMDGDKERALETGADDYDTKPVNFPRLMTKIKDLLASA